MKELFESSYLSVMSEENNRLRKEIERLQTIIKEAREYILNLENSEEINVYQEDKSWVYILEILDKENK